MVTDLVMMIVLVPYHIIRYLVCHRENDGILAEYEAKARKRQDFIDRVTDPELEREVIKYLYAGNFEKYKEELFDAIREVPELAHNVKYPIENPLVAMGAENATRVVMANRGKIVRGDADFGIEGRCVPGRSAVNKEMLVLYSHLVVWMMNKLRSAGIYDKVILKEHDGTTHEVVDAEQCIKIGGGKYWWEPCL